MQTKSDATAAGLAAKAKLPNKGRGWRLRVWNNTGWRWCLHCGPVTIYPSGAKFHTLIAPRMERTVGAVGYGTGGEWTPGIDSHAKTPTASVRKAIAGFRKYVAEDRERFDKLLAALPEMKA